MRNFCSVTLATLLAVCVCATSVLGAPINYGDFMGTDYAFESVREASATDPYPANDPLFGAPFVDGNRLIFSPFTNGLFTSFASNGNADTTSGTLSMIVRAVNVPFLTKIIIHETGDYSLLGAGTPATSATINGLLAVTEIEPGSSPTMTAPLTVNPAAPYQLVAPATSGDFTASTELDLTGLGISEIILVFNNTLQTTSETTPTSGTTAFIQKKTIIIEVPEPATAGLLAFSGVAILLRRRRR